MTLIVRQMDLTVMKKMWGPDDEYFVIPIGDIQVFDMPEGTRVVVNIEVVERS